MGFNPLKMFNENSQKVTPPRGVRGRFVSTKKITPKTDPKIDTSSQEEIIGPILVTFYGHNINKYYKDNIWYFSIDDVAHCADTNPDNPDIKKGDPVKLEESITEYGVKIDNINTAKGEDLAKFVQYFKGNMPGRITEWLIETAKLPAPLQTNEAEA
ncbi:hypothetical protein BH10PAT1_BH10PAT1_1040 [soil metagenome]